MSAERWPALCEAISADFGWRSHDFSLMADILLPVNGLKYARKNLRRWMAPQRRSTSLWFLPGRSRVVTQPLGVVGHHIDHQPDRVLEQRHRERRLVLQADRAQAAAERQSRLAERRPLVKERDQLDRKLEAWQREKSQLDERLADPSNVRRVQFHIAESEYAHGDRLEVRIVGPRLLRRAEPAVAAVTPINAAMRAPRRCGRSIQPASFQLRIRRCPHSCATVCESCAGAAAGSAPSELPSR